MDIRTSRLQSAFIESGLTQTELCSRTGITKGALSSYLSGRYFPKQIALEKLSNALNVTVYYLMGLDAESDDFSSLSASEEMLLSFFRQLNAEGQDQLINQARVFLYVPEYKKRDPSEMVSEG